MSYGDVIILIMANNITHSNVLESSIFRDNKEKSRFELHVDNATAYVDYILDHDTIALYNTEIPASIAKIDNSGIHLIRSIVTACRDRNTKLFINCPYAKAISKQLHVTES